MNRDPPAAAFVVVASMWIRDGRREAFDAFERKALRVVAKHGGVLDRVVRVEPRAGEDDPHEIHVLAFPGRDAFDAWRRDPEALALADERASVIARTTIACGVPGPGYDD